MHDAIKPLVESGIITEDTRLAIEQAWQSQLTEAKQQLEEQMRVEFAERYEHDKGQLVEAIDRKITESLVAELEEFRQDKRVLAEQTVKTKQRLMESANTFNKFMQTQLAKEIIELREDRQSQKDTVKKLERFVIEQLTHELMEFQQDKRDVVNTKVRLVKEAKQKINQLQQQFVSRSAQLVKEAIESNLKTELVQLKEDINSAKKNMFGRKLFEAFASEFALTQLNENQQLKQLAKKVKVRERALQESKNKMQKLQQLAESRAQELKRLEESKTRQEMMGKLLRPLNPEKAAVMRDLLESVQTAKLQAAFDKYLPAVLNEGKNSTTKTNGHQVLAESRSEVTGDKQTAKPKVQEDGNNVLEIKRLAGLK